MNFGLKGRTALVLGGSRGLGLGAAESLATEGADVVLVGRDKEALWLAQERIQAKNVTAISFSADFADDQSVENLLSGIKKTIGHVDVILLNGGGPSPFIAASFDANSWRAEFNAMVLNQMRVAVFFLAGMQERRWGRIIVVSSTSAREPIAGLTASNALRPALAGWAKTLAGEVAAEGITVNLLLPGRLATERTARLDRLDAELLGVDPAAIAAESQAEIPMKRYGTPAEFGAVVAFLASDGAAYITGTAIPVDGGLSRSML